MYTSGVRRIWRIRKKHFAGRRTQMYLGTLGMSRDKERGGKEGIFDGKTLVLIFGPSGTGKTTVGKELARRGYNVINTDNLLSVYVNNSTGAELEVGCEGAQRELLGERFHREYSMRWSWAKFHDVVRQAPQGITIFCGTGTSVSEFLDVFHVAMALRVSDEVMIERLQGRAPKRYSDGSILLKRAIYSNRTFDKRFKGRAFRQVDAESHYTEVADRIEKILSVYLEEGR